ncbi:MAG: hypothetical protein IJ660_06580 [Alphaproteobacteria bacterium]|nr:hypothetical protein [Alphaproteobacteria bacterium]
MGSFLLIITAVCLFIFSYYSFLLCEKKHNQNSSDCNLILQPINVFILLGFVGCLCCAYIIPDQNDFLVPVSLWIVPAVFASALILRIGLRPNPNNILNLLLLTVLCSVNVFLLPNDFSLTHGLLPVYAEKGILVFCWILFSWFYNILNGVDGILPLQSLSITIGFILMYIIGIMPELYCGWNSVFAVILLSFAFFNNYPASLSLATRDCRILGFFIGWLILLAAIEGNLSCALILSMYYIYEVIIATIKKLSFQKQFKILEENTFYNYLNTLGANPKNICELIARINLVLMLLAGFQIYAPNEYTLVLIAFFAVFWMTFRVLSPQNEQQHILLSGSILSALFKKKKSK